MSNRFRVSRPLILQTLVLGILCGVTVQAQRDAGPAPAGAPGDPALARGQTLFVQSCGFCHGADARGGAEGGSDLTASPIVMADQSGSTLGPFLRVGRPERKMPPFTLLPEQVTDIAAYLRSFRRQALHAERLDFVHPNSGETISTSAPMPTNIIALLAALRDDTADFNAAK